MFQIQYDYSQEEWAQFKATLLDDCRITTVWEINRYICPHHQLADTSIKSCDTCGETTAGKKIYVQKQYRLETRDGGYALFIDDYHDQIIRVIVINNSSAFCPHRFRDELGFCKNCYAHPEVIARGD